MKVYFVSDLHGHTSRYEKLFREIENNAPDMVLLGGDLLPHGMHRNLSDDFTEQFLYREFQALRDRMGDTYPYVGLILGNDDPKTEEARFVRMSETGIWHYLHNRKDTIGGYTLYGYSNIPPTPFRFKDWERYDVSRYVDPGCIHPMEGFHSVPPEVDLEFATILDELKQLTGEGPLTDAILLAHSPPYKTVLDRAALDGMTYDHVPLDVHVGSIAIMRLIEERQPLATLHGHIHESTRLTGAWRQQTGRTHSFNAAWDGPELVIVEFDPEDITHAAHRVL